MLVVLLLFIIIIITIIIIVIIVDVHLDQIFSVPLELPLLRKRSNIETSEKQNFSN